MKFKKNLLLMGTAFSVCSISLGSAASETTPAAAPAPVSEGTEKQSAPRTVLHFTLLDAPYNFRHGYKSPSMAESLDLSRSWYSAVHYGLEHILPDEDTRLKRWLRFSLLLATDYSLSTLPLSTAWTHEEWHRAVMTHRGVPSHNTINDFKPFGEVYSVNGQSDEDHIRLKSLYPKDQLRLSIAGNESEREFIQSLKKDHFYRNLKSSNNLPLMWLIQLGSSGYIQSIVDGDLDKTIVEIEKREGNNIRARDFVGPDYSGWVRDLFRPNEKYEERGQHPSGVGIKRYTAFADLSKEEKDYLKKQNVLHYLNFFDPELFGFDSFSMTSPATGRRLGLNASLAHYFAPFGYALKLNLFMKTIEKQTPFGTQGLFFAWQQNINKERSLPQIEMEHRPLPLSDTPFGLGARVMLWMQPKDLDFNATKSDFGGLVAAKLIHNAAQGWQPWIEVSGKTKGWVAGEVDLGSTYGLRAGLDVELTSE
ncbi:MAG: hypothetical protein RLZZ488_1132 [Pseudomonadota bacterium]